MPSPSRTAALGWVLVSYFLIAGGFALAAVAVTLSGITSQGPSDAVFFVGSLIGGVFAGRASRHKAVAEPAIAALLVVATLIAVFVVGLGRQFAWAAEGDAFWIPVKLGLVAGLGGFVGGLVGRRSRGGARSDSGFRWWGIATLINLGASFILVSITLVLLNDGSDERGAGSIFLGLVVAWLIAGFVSQAVAPRKMVWVCGAGAIGIVLFGAAFSVERGDFAPSVVTSAALLWGMGTVVGAIGAALGWKLIGRRAEPTSPVELPEVRLLE